MKNAEQNCYGHGASTVAITGCFLVATGKDKTFNLINLFNNLK